MRMRRKHIYISIAIGVVDRRGQQKTRFVVPVNLAMRYEAKKVTFTPFSTVWLCLLGAQS